MGFEDIPEDAQESHPCPECGGVVEFVIEDDLWVCVEPGGCTWSMEDQSP